MTAEPMTSERTNRQDRDPVSAINSQTSTSGLFTGLRLFQGVDADIALTNLNRTTRRDLDAGEILLSPEIKNENVYILASGRLRVHLDSMDNPPLLQLEPGDCAGEMSIIEERDPSAWVIADEPCHLIIINRDVLWDLIEASHAFSRNMLRLLSERLRQDNDAIVGNSGKLREFQRTAVTDALTELHNRHWMGEMFRRKIGRMQHAGIPASLLMLDVDHFKRFNDRYGHIAGDHALCHVASTLREHFRPCDMIARFGGDEFAVLLPDTDCEGACQIAERVRQAVHENLESEAGNPDEPPITISVGIAEMSQNDTLESLINNADSALYRAKMEGRNRICS